MQDKNSALGLNRPPTILQLDTFDLLTYRYLFPGAPRDELKAIGKELARRGFILPLRVFIHLVLFPALWWNTAIGRLMPWEQDDYILKSDVFRGWAVVLFVLGVGSFFLSWNTRIWLMGTGAAIYFGTVVVMAILRNRT